MRIKMNKRCRCIKKLRVHTVKLCTMCGKKFDMWDEQENFSIRKTVGYGSGYDGSKINLQLCCGCFDKVLDMIVPMCKEIPVTDPYEEMCQNADLCLGRYYSRRKQVCFLCTPAAHIGRQRRPKTARLKAL